MGNFPDREAIRLGVMHAIHEWEIDQEIQSTRSLSEHIVDTIIAPLVIQLSMTSGRVSNEVHGQVTGTVTQAGDIGELRL